MRKLPDAFARLSLTALPEAERPLLLEALRTGVPLRGLRLRPGVALDTVRAALPGAYPPVPWAKDGYYLDADAAAGVHPLHAAGAYYLQEPSAMCAAPLLDVRPGQRVLDLCAAPGGKSTQLAACLAGRGVLVANEIVPGRCRVLSQNLERMGVTNAVVTCESPDRLAARWGGWFDRILVDAPCSGEGMFRREAASLEVWTEKTPAGCAARQAQILRQAARLLAPGGVLVYSTCTFNALENEAVVEAFCQEQPDFLLERTVRLWPHRVAGEGHFAARLRRQGDAPPHAPDGPGTALDGVWDAYAGLTLPGRVETMGERVWLLPESLPELRGVRVLRAGLCLGERRGGRFLPDHAAAMALPLPGVSADAAAAARYLHGEALEAGGQAAGWTVVRYAGLALGWAKCADGVLKNHLPKGLRK